ncbi:MAG: hypothetical protein RI993_19 [Pseudomonadota bacterium]|jgi:hypothetical protein
MHILKLIPVFLLLLLCQGTTAVAHTGLPNMAFAWSNGKIVVDTQREGRTLGGYTAFTIRFDGTLKPYQMSDAGISGFGFNPGSIIQYQIESTLMKWSTVENRWLRDGFDERLSIRLAFAAREVSASEGENTHGMVASLGSTGSFEGTHPLFELTTADGSAPDDGAYMIAMTLFGTDEQDGSITHPPSKPFLLALHLNVSNNFGQTAFNQAFDQFPGTPLSDYSRLDQLYDWAETNFSEFFPHAAQSRFVFGIYARCYNSTICVGSRRGKVFTTGGPFGGLTDHGSLESFFEAAGL